MRTYIDKKVLFVQPVFCPNETLLQKNIESVKSFVNYCDKNNYLPYATFGGWCAKREYWDEIFKYTRQCANANNHVFRFEKNYGKAIVVNHLVKEFITKNNNLGYEHFLTADSDIIFDENEPEMFHRLIYAESILEERFGKKLGLISLNQKVNCCHIDSFTNQNEIVYPYFPKDITEKFGYPNGVPQGIAGGCLFTSFEAWKNVGGYPVMGVYSGDDGYLILKTYKANRLVAMMKSLSVIHPDESDKLYQEWKHNQIKKCDGIHKKSILSEVVDAENFWERR